MQSLRSPGSGSDGRIGPGRCGKLALVFAARRRRVVAVAAAVALLLSGCGGQVGNAAIVDGTAIAVADLLAQTEQVSGLPSGTMATDRLETDQLTLTNRALLSREVQHEILTRAGLGVTATPEQLSGLEQQYGLDNLYAQLDATPDTFAERVGDVLAFERLLSAAVASGTGIQGPVVDVDVIPFATLAEGHDAYNRYRIDPELMTAEFAERGGGSGTLTLPGQATIIPVGVFSAPAGTFFLLPTDDGGANVAKVTANRIGDQGVDASTASQLTPQDFSTLGALLLSQQLASSGAAAPVVDVNPRFGVWDAALLQVVARS